MKLIEIVKLTNKLIAGEQLTFDRLTPYLDSVIDDINNSLNATFPAFSSINYDSSNADRIEYNAFPDRYIRSVVCYGAAHKFYLIDEEGVDSAPDLANQYRTNLFYMTRDYMEQVPVFYRSDSSGSVEIDIDSQAFNDGVFMKGFI